MNNISSKKQSKQKGKVRTSVLDKLHQKQREIAVRSGKQQPEQVMRQRWNVTGNRERKDAMPMRVRHLSFCVFFRDIMAYNSHIADGG